MENQTAFIYGAGLFIIFSLCRVYLNKFIFTRSKVGFIGISMIMQISLNNFLDFTPNPNYPPALQNLGYQAAQITNLIAIVVLGILIIMSLIRIVSNSSVFSKQPEFGDFSSMSNKTETRNQA